MASVNYEEKMKKATEQLDALVEKRNELNKKIKLKQKEIGEYELMLENQKYALLMEVAGECGYSGVEQLYKVLKKTAQRKLQEECGGGQENAGY